MSVTSRANAPRADTFGILVPDPRSTRVCPYECRRVRARTVAHRRTCDLPGRLAGHGSVRYHCKARPGAYESLEILVVLPNMSDTSLPRLLIVIASTRPGRIGLPIGTWFEGLAREHGGFELEVADLAELDLPLMNEPNHPRLQQYTHDHTKQWAAMVDRADAYVFVIPEYNYSMTAPLKNALDYVQKEWAAKPVGFVSYGGISGGIRAAMMARQVTTALGMYEMQETVSVVGATNLVEDGTFNATEQHERNATAVLDALATWAPAMRAVRLSGK